jgi:N-methylhydantoinase A
MSGGSMRVGIDIGGTFTDLVVATDEGIIVRKVSSTPRDPSAAFAAALERAPEGEPDEVLHGTTVATNAVLTRSGAELAFITTKGFRHLLQLARQSRPSLYDLAARRTPPLAHVSHCVGVLERIGPHGDVWHELDEDATRWALEDIRGVDGVAVCLLHSYANPDHERRVAELVREVLGPDVAISVSSEVLPEFREYERASTTALNAYVQPVLERYLRRIESVSGPSVGVMWSGGGVRSIARTITSPVHTMFSGPAAGVLGATWAANACGVRDIVTLDMGGTSADVALVEDLHPQIAEESSIDGLPFRTPCLDVISVGAGGGSIGWLDEGGALRVGPRSAGAEPGPACYGRGGEDATVTDAQVVLGYLGAEGLAGGDLVLDGDAAWRALERLGEPAGLTPIGAAEGVLRVVRATMARAIRSVSVERGKDVRRFTLVAFGGAGPLHATALARELGIAQVIVPPAPGALAALGLLVASRRADASVSRPLVASAGADAELREILSDLTRAVLDDLASDGVAATAATIERHVDCRYVGQSHELRIAVRDDGSFADIVRDYHDAHRARYGFDRPDVAVEAVTFRATALGPPGDVTIAPPSGPAAVAVTACEVGGVEVAVYDRASLAAGARIDGPAIVRELDSTTWLDADSSAVVHSSGALVVDVTTTAERGARSERDPA